MFTDCLELDLKIIQQFTHVLDGGYANNIAYA